MKPVSASAVTRLEGDGLESLPGHLQADQLGHVLVMSCMLSVLDLLQSVAIWVCWRDLLTTSQPFVPSAMLNRTTLWQARRTAMPPKGLYRVDSACAIVERCMVHDPSRRNAPRCSLVNASAQQTCPHESFGTFSP